MNEEMQKQVSKILELMLVGLEKAGNIASDQLPGLVQDYITYYFIEALPIGASIAAISAFIVAFLIIGFIHNGRKKETISEDSIVGCSFLVGISILVGVGFLAITIEDAKELVKIKMAPKAYIIEKLRK